MWASRWKETNGTGRNEKRKHEMSYDTVEWRHDHQTMLKATTMENTYSCKNTHRIRANKYAVPMQPHGYLALRFSYNCSSMFTYL